jgi:hypothetical protein
MAVIEKLEWQMRVVSRPSPVRSGIRSAFGAAPGFGGLARLESIGLSLRALIRGEPVALGRVDASELRAGLRESRRADGDGIREAGRSGNE